MNIAKLSSKLFLESRLTRESISVAFGTLLLSIASWVSVPMIPVPVTMQTYAVLMLGAVYGARLASITLLTWLGQAALGLPVLAGGASGIYTLIGARGGYFLGFLISAYVIGKCFKSKAYSNHVVKNMVFMLLGHVIILFAGFIWLAQFVGWKNSFYFGVIPFLSGSLLKSMLAVVTLRFFRRF